MPDETNEESQPFKTKWSLSYYERKPNGLLHKKQRRNLQQGNTVDKVYIDADHHAEISVEVMFKEKDMPRGTIWYVATDLTLSLRQDGVEPVRTPGGTITSVPVLGGGLVGPGGINSVPTTQITAGSGSPQYSLYLSDPDVEIVDLSDAVGNLLSVSDLLLTVENYDDVYLGQTEVQVKFYQNGYPSFRFVGPRSSIIPFSLYLNGVEAEPYLPYTPWPAPLRQENTAPIALMVDPSEYATAMQGDYSATITVEMITGI